MPPPPLRVQRRHRGLHGHGQRCVACTSAQLPGAAASAFTRLSGLQLLITPLPAAARRIHETEKGYYADGEVRVLGQPLCAHMPGRPLGGQAATSCLCDAYLPVSHAATPLPLEPTPLWPPVCVQDAYSMRLTFPEGEKAAAEKAAAAAKQQQQQGSGDKPAAAVAARKGGKRR